MLGPYMDTLSTSLSHKGEDNVIVKGQSSRTKLSPGSWLDPGSRPKPVSDPRTSGSRMRKWRPDNARMLGQTDASPGGHKQRVNSLRTLYIVSEINEPCCKG